MGSSKFCQRELISKNVFFCLMRAANNRKALKVGHHRPASETPYYAIETPIKRSFTGGPKMAKQGTLAFKACDFMGVQTSIANCDLSGGADPLSLSGSAHVKTNTFSCDTMLWSE